MKRHFIILFLLLLVAAFFLASCATAPKPSLVIPYAVLGDYTVTVKDGGEDTSAAANELAAAISEKVGVAPSVSDELLGDAAKQIAVVLPEEIGYPKMKQSDYKIFFVDSNIYVTVGSAAVRGEAINSLLSMMQNGELIVPADGYAHSHSYAAEEIMINGKDIAHYALYATPESQYFIELLRDGIRDLCGYILPITDEQNELTISLAVGEGLDCMNTTVTSDADGITISGNDKDAMYFGVCAFLDFLESAIADGSINMTLSETKLSNVAYAAPSARAFYNEAGELDRDGDGEIHIAFIGGSLTQTNQVWCPPVVKYFQSMFPNKTVTYTNAAIGATDSTMGAIRFAHDVLDVVSPDIVFVEYAVNDAGFETENDYALRKNGVYIESIIRQCLAHENQPAVALLYFPRGFALDSTACSNWENGVALKERIAKNYGVKSVNVLDYVKSLYDSQKVKRPDLSYGDFLLQYYKSSDMVHPTNTGYGVFRDAILAALEADFEGFLTNRLDADFCLAQYERDIMTRWELVPLNDSSIELEGDIVHYESIPSYPSSDPRYIPSNSFTYPRFLEGIWQVESKTPFSISITTDANIVGFYGLYSTKADGMSVSITNKSSAVVLGRASIAATGSEHGRPYLTTIKLSAEGNRETYTITQSAGNNGTIFRAGYIVLGTYAE